MEIYVGTSGWLYSWNLGKSLEWYVEHSGLNAVELNASFYRYPTPKQIERWAEVGRSLRWAIKVHQGVTHFGRLSEKALERLGNFLQLFKPLDRLIDFYLFQMPPSFQLNDVNMRRVENVAAILGKRAVFEFRHPSWFVGEVVRWAEEVGFVVASVDSPDLSWIVATNGVVYLRMHGRTLWYSHYYDEEELREVASKIVQSNAERVYVFFNNDHAMLENARAMLSLLASS